jgi:antitoxin PrlF
MAKVATSKVTSKGQVTVPEDVRRALAIARGDRLEWVTGADGRVEVRKVQGRLSALVGLLGTPARTATIPELDDAVRQMFRKRHARG